MRRKLLAGLLGLVTALGVTLAIASPANATPPTGCTSGWSSWYNQGTDWGQVRFCYAFDYTENLIYWQFEVDDTKTDGYAVHLEACIATQCGAPSFIPPPNYSDEIHSEYPLADYCPQSSGPVYTTPFGALITNWSLYVGQYSGYLNVRTVRGRCWSPGPHQDTAHFDIHLAD